DQDNLKDQGNTLKSGDTSTLNSLVRNESPRSLQLWGIIGSGNIHVLIDNGSTHNFVQPGVVERMKLAVSITKPLNVDIGSGETLLYENICSKVGINMQGLAVEVDLYVLPRKGPDVVLGIQWLQKLGKDHMGAKDCCLMGLRKKRCGASCNEGFEVLFIVKIIKEAKIAYGSVMGCVEGLVGDVWEIRCEFYELGL
ncbi:ty3-gypsy retrotransposon protein, partial [Tanacetum coccineum]